MRRVISLFLPTWRTDRVRRRNPDAPSLDVPLIIATNDGNRRVIVEADAAACRNGLSAGMTVAHAQSLVPALCVLEETPREDSTALARLGIWCMRYAPLVTLDPPTGLFIDVTGATHLFKSEAALLRDLTQRLNIAQFRSRVALADTPGCAWAVARYGPGGIVAQYAGMQALAELPLAAMRLPETTIESLHDVGIDRIGDLIAKPRSSLALRFGGQLLLRFDQAMGAMHEALPSLQASEAPRATLKFAEPVGDPADLERIIGRLCVLLCADLEQRGLGARRLDLVFLRVDNTPQAIRIGTASSTRDAKHLAKLLVEKLTLVDPGFGIEDAALIALRTEPLKERQSIGRHVAAPGSEADVEQLVDKLAVRLGAKCVFRLTPVESDIPERSAQRISPVASPKKAIWPSDLPRPARLFSSPEYIMAVAEVPDAPPAFFIWRKVRHRIVKADGPERILGEWWLAQDEEETRRDYYRVEDERGERFWIFRDAVSNAGARWWLHGLGEA